MVGVFVIVVFVHYPMGIGMPDTRSLEIHPEFASVRSLSICGIVILASVIALLLSRSYELVMMQQTVLLCGILLAILFLVDGLSERLVFANGQFEFRSLFRRRERVVLSVIDQVFISPRGWLGYLGMVTVLFVKRTKILFRFDLGPFWRQSQLDEFVQAVIASEAPIA